MNEIGEKEDSTLSNFLKKVTSESISKLFQTEVRAEIS